MLNGNCGYVLHSLRMTQDNPVDSVEFCSSYGTYLLDHLAADGAGLTGGQVTVVAVGQVDTDFGCGLHLELVHGFTSLGNVQLVVVLRTHIRFSPLLSSDENTFRRKHFLFRNHSLTEDFFDMNVKWRKEMKIVPLMYVSFLAFALLPIFEFLRFLSIAPI